MNAEYDVSDASHEFRWALTAGCLSNSETLSSYLGQLQSGHNIIFIWVVAKYYSNFSNGKGWLLTTA